MCDFPQNLWELLNDPWQSYMEWTRNGFMIHSIKAFMQHGVKQLLPRSDGLFKTFRRQLNWYRFSAAIRGDRMEVGSPAGFNRQINTLTSPPKRPTATPFRKQHKRDLIQGECMYAMCDDRNRKYDIRIRELEAQVAFWHRAFTKGELELLERPVRTEYVYLNEEDRALMCQEGLPNDE